MNEDIGYIAQADFMKWAFQGGMTPTQPNVDREGWDFIVQFHNLSLEPGKPIDRSAPRIQCMVQVKGTLSKRKRKSIELSVWHKLVYANLPAFFLVAKYGNTREAKELFLIHVGKEWIETVARRLRESDLQDITKLNKHTLNLTWSQRDKLPEVGGDAIAEAIQSHIGNFDDYIQQKQKWRKELGVEAPFQIRFISQPYNSREEFMENWIDFAIGIRESITGHVIVEKDVRFGKPAEVEEYKNSLISIVDRSNITKKLKLHLRDQFRSKTATFDADLITPDFAFPGEQIPPDLRKVRITSEIGDLIFRPQASKQLTLTINFGWGLDSRPLNEFVNLAKAILLLHNAEPGTRYLDLYDGEKKLFSITSRDKTEIPKEMLIYALLVSRTWELVRYFELPFDIRVTPEQLLDQKKEIETLVTIGNPVVPIIMLSGHLIEYESVTNDKVLALVVVKLNLEHDITAIIGFEGTAVYERNEEIVKLTIDNPQRLYQNAFLNLSENELEDLKTKISNDFKENGFEVIITDGVGLIASSQVIGEGD